MFGQDDSALELYVGRRRRDAGKWFVPGGSAELVDRQRLRWTASRETKEEADLVVGPKEWLLATTLQSVMGFMPAGLYTSGRQRRDSHI